MSGPVFDAVRGAAGYAKEDITIVGPLPIPVVTPPPAAVLLCPIGGNAYWRDDGVAATIADGFPLLADTTFYYVGNLANISVIGDGGTILHCSFYY